MNTIIAWLKSRKPLPEPLLDLAACCDDGSGIAPDAQALQQMGSQGIADPSGLLAGIPPGLQGLPPQLAAQLMQVRHILHVAICAIHVLASRSPVAVMLANESSTCSLTVGGGVLMMVLLVKQAQATQSNPMHNPLQMLQLMQNMGTLPPHMLPLLLQARCPSLALGIPVSALCPAHASDVHAMYSLAMLAFVGCHCMMCVPGLQAQMQQMAAAGGPGAHAGGLAPGMNPLLGMGMGPGALLSGMHPLANLQDQLQGFALFQVRC